MEPKVIFLFCLQLVTVKYTQAMCTPYAAIPEAFAPVDYITPGCSAFTSGLTMQTAMVPGPSFFVMSDDLFVEGLVTVSGTLPFLGTVGLEGVVPTAGQGTVIYNSGNGAVGMLRETPYLGNFIAPGPVLC